MLNAVPWRPPTAHNPSLFVAACDVAHTCCHGCGLSCVMCKSLTLTSAQAMLSGLLLHIDGEALVPVIAAALQQVGCLC